MKTISNLLTLSPILLLTVACGQTFRVDSVPKAVQSSQANTQSLSMDQMRAAHNALMFAEGSILKSMMQQQDKNTLPGQPRAAITDRCGDWGITGSPGVSFRTAMTTLSLDSIHVARAIWAMTDPASLPANDASFVERYGMGAVVINRTRLVRNEFHITDDAGFRIKPHIFDFHNARTTTYPRVSDILSHKPYKNFRVFEADRAGKFTAPTQTKFDLAMNKLVNAPPFAKIVDIATGNTIQVNASCQRLIEAFEIGRKLYSDYQQNLPYDPFANRAVFPSGDGYAFFNVKVRQSIVIGGQEKILDDDMIILDQNEPRFPRGSIPTLKLAEGTDNHYHGYSSKRVTTTWPTETETGKPMVIGPVQAAFPVNGASNKPVFAAGMSATFYVVGLGIRSTITTSTDSQGALPTEVNGVSVVVAGKPAELSFVSPSQINFIIPTDTPVTSDVSVLVTNGKDALEPVEGRAHVDGDPAAAIFSVNIATAAPGLFASGLTKWAAGTYSVVGGPLDQLIASYSGSPNAIPKTLGARETYIALYGTGFGNISLAEVAQFQSIRITMTGPSGIITVPNNLIKYIGRPESQRFNQINFILPPGLSAGVYKVKLTHLSTENQSNEVELFIVD